MYQVYFPTSSPYVTAVGGTQGPELTKEGVFDGSEITCSSVTKAAITSGGAFSNYYMRANTASFQSTAVDNYLKSVAGTNRAPAVGFNTGGRAYPDIAAVAAAYAVVADADGGHVVMHGTSASAPFIAGLFSNVNAKRLAAGKGSLGWVNPTLYQTYIEFTNDITEGNNLCVADGTCCSEGFYAAKGWDPTTGIYVYIYIHHCIRYVEMDMCIHKYLHICYLLFML
jgi:tripeptidyl-peptidase-1